MDAKSGFFPQIETHKQYIGQAWIGKWTRR